MTIISNGRRVLLQPNLKRRSAALSLDQDAVSSGYSTFEGVPVGPRIPADGPVIFYYSLDWIDENRPPEIGEGLQQTAAVGGTLIPGLVGQAVETQQPGLVFQSAGNFNETAGTLGFWCRKETVTSNTNLFLVDVSSGNFRLYVAPAGFLRIQYGGGTLYTIPETADVPEGDWYFVEIGWNTATQEYATRVNGEAWTVVTNTGMAHPPTGVGATMQLGSQSTADRLIPLDQFFIADRFMENLYRYRYSDRILPPALVEEDLLFWYSCDSTDQGRPPEVGQGVQQVISNSGYVSAPTGRGLDGLPVVPRFPFVDTSETNIDLNKGTMGFWVKMQTHAANAHVINSSDKFRISANADRTYTFTYDNATVTIYTQGVAETQWSFFEVSWDFVNTELSTRVDGGPWTETVDAANITALPVGTQLHIGDFSASGETVYIDQVIISEPYQDNLYAFRYSTDLIEAPPVEPPPPEPVIPQDGTVAFYYSADWIAFNQAPEIGQGVQSEPAPGGTLVPGQVNQAVENEVPAMRFDVAGNVNVLLGTIGFWLKNKDYGSTQNIMRVGPGGDIWRIYINTGQLSFRVGDRTTTHAIPGMTDDWNFIELAWDVLGLTVSRRWNGGPWVDLASPAMEDQGATDTEWTYGPTGTSGANAVTTDQILISPNYKQDLYQYSNSTEYENAPPPAPAQQLIFTDDTLVRTPVTLDQDEVHYISYETYPLDPPFTREQFLWCTDNPYGDGLIARTRMKKNNDLSPTRSQNESNKVDVALVVGELAHIEEEYQIVSGTAGAVFFKKNGVTIGQASVGTGGVTNAISIGGRALLKGQNLSYRGVLRNFKVFAADGTKLHHWEIKATQFTEGMTIPDIVGTANATLELGNSTTEDWDDTFPTYPEPPTQAPPVSTVVPNILGMTVAEATTELANFTLLPGTETQEFNASVDVGLIYSQTPIAGTSAELNDTVDFSTSLGVEPTRNQTIFDGTVLTLPINVDNTKFNLVEYDVRPVEDGARPQEIWSTNTAHSSGRHSRAQYESEQALRFTRGSDSGQKTPEGLTQGEWHSVRETLFIDPDTAVDSYVTCVLDTEEILDPGTGEESFKGQVRAGNASNITDDVTIGGRDAQPTKYFNGAIREFKYFEWNDTLQEYELLHHYPLDEVLTGLGDEVTDVVTGRKGSVTTLGNLTQEARDPDLPPLPPAEYPVSDDPPSEPEEPPPVDPGQFIVFAEDFENSPVGALYKGTGSRVRNDPTGGGKGRVLELAFAPGKLRPCSQTYNLPRSILEATFTFDIYINPAWSDDWLVNSKINSKMPGPAGGTGGISGCVASTNGFSSRTMLFSGRWEAYKYWNGKPDRCGNHDKAANRQPGVPGWQTVKFWIKMNPVPGQKTGEYQIWVNDQTPGKQGNIPWRAAGRNFKIERYMWEIFVNNGKKWPNAPRSANTMYITNFLVTSPEAP